MDNMQARLRATLRQSQQKPCVECHFFGKQGCRDSNLYAACKGPEGDGSGSRWKPKQEIEIYRGR